MAANSVPAQITVSKIATVYETAAVITPTDNTLVGPFAALYVGVAGDITLVPRNGTTAVLFKAVPVGILPFAVQGVNSTGTTATNILGLS